MTTLTVQSEVRSDGKLKIEVPCGLPPGPLEVVLTVRTQTDRAAGPQPRWGELLGLGREVWQGIDPQEYVRELRQDRGTLE
jgi:hypothetical protein